MRTILVLALLVAVGLAGCTTEDVETRPTFNVEFATPGVWNISGPVDYIWVWAHNARDEQYILDWNLTLAGGQPLPDGWNFTYASSYDVIEPADSTHTDPQTGRTFYSDWAWAIFRLEVPMDERSGSYPAEVHTGFFTKDVLLGVSPVRANVTEVGDQVYAKYVEGRFWDDGEVFWKIDGDDFQGFEVGSPDTIVGFSYGILGLATGERVNIVVPPAWAYGFDIPEDHERHQFSGEALEYTVGIVNTDPEMNTTL